MVGAHVWDLGYLGDIRFGEQIAETVYSGKSYVTDNLVMATNSQPPGDCLPSRDTGDVSRLPGSLAMGN